MGGFYPRGACYRPPMSAPAAIAARIRQWEAQGPQGPMTLELYPTLKCNLDCRFCDTTERHQPRQRELPLSKHLELLDQAAEMGVQRVFILGGGEPLVARDLTPAIMRRVKELGMEGVLTTNGTILPDSLLRQLIETGWDEIHVSIDGATAAVHDDLRGTPGAFRKTVRNLCRLRVAREQAGQHTPRLAIHSVLTNLNYRQLPELVRLAAALGCFRLDVDGLIAYRPEQKVLELSAQQQRELTGIAAQAHALAQRLDIASTLDLYTRVHQRGQAVPDLPQSGGTGLEHAPCLKAWHYLVVQADGRTSPCCVLAGEGESVADTSLSSLWEQSPFLNAVRQGMLKGEPLARCAECSPNILAHEREIRAAL